MRIAVVTPSRGMVWAPTVDSVEAEIAAARVEGHDIRWHVVSGLPIPDSHETCVERALEDQPEAIWFVEEDMIIPPGALAALLEVLETHDVAHLDYPVGDQSMAYNCCWHKDKSTVEPASEPLTGPLLWSGFGCLLIRREVFDVMPRPWFRSDRTYQIVQVGTQISMIETDTPAVHGGFDIDFGIRANALGLTIGCVDPALMTASQCRLENWAEVRAINNGTHRWFILSRIDRWH
jgi:hypothetical protein